MNALNNVASQKFNAFINFIKRYKPEFIISLIAFIITFILSLSLSTQIIQFFKDQVPFNIRYIQVFPEEFILNIVKISTLSGLFFALPVILFQFIKLFGDKARQTALKKLAICSYIASIIGVLFACFIAIPINLYFLLGINSRVAEIVFELSPFISFCLSSVFISVLVFQVPVIIWFSKKSEFFKYESLLKTKKQTLSAILILAIIIAVPPELLAFFILLAALLLAYAVLLYTVKRNQ